MNIEFIKAKNINNKINTDISIHDIRKLVNSKKILIISDCFDKKLIDNILDKVHEIGIKHKKKTMRIQQK